MSDSVEVFLNGGVGNQLFGWAAAQTLAENLNVPLTLNISNLSHRGFQLQKLDLGACHISDKASYIYSIKSELLRAIYRKTLLSSDFFEKSFGYDHRLGSVHKPIRLHGYFQSFKYFVGNPKIRDTLSNPCVTSLEYEKLKSSLDLNNSLAIHIRRGDYLQNLDYHGVVGAPYYMEALQLSKTTCGSKSLVVFTDDLIEAKRTVPNAAAYVTSETLPSPLENILLMSQFSGLIGANSSFSYWAGVIMESNFKVFPKKWFATSTVSTQDLLPPDFLTL